MDLVSTPPMRSPVHFFGISHYTWAPKRPTRPDKPDKKRRPSRRSLDFTGMLDEEMNGEVKTSLEKFLSQENTTRLPTPEYERGVRTPGRPEDTSLVSGRNIARRIDFTAAAATTPNQGAENVVSGFVDVSPRPGSFRLVEQIYMGTTATIKKPNPANVVVKPVVVKRPLHSTGEKNEACVKKARLTRLMR